VRNRDGVVSKEPISIMPNPELIFAHFSCHPFDVFSRRFTKSKDDSRWYYTLFARLHISRKDLAGRRDVIDQL
jgi:hypothetical protein